MEEQIIKLKVQVYDLSEALNTTNAVLAKIAAACGNADSLEKVLEYIEGKNPAN